ncbi:MAG: IS256 family transposase [Bacillota bacterium]|nr:IS256 family transposase [Bacillota bacterium]
MKRVPPSAQMHEAVEMYARGLSTRDIEDALREAAGERLLSRTQVSAITDSLWKEYEAFRDRRLDAFQVQYLFLDAIFEPLRRTGTVREGVLAASGITLEGRRVLLHLALGSRESEADWLDFLRDMVRRGLNVPLSVTTDGAPGLIRAVEAVFPKSLRIRCWVHKVRNILDKVPEEMREEVRVYLAAVRDAPNLEEGRRLAQDFVARYERVLPSAVHSFQDDLEASLQHLRLPTGHRKFVRTTNLIERSFEEERRRTKVLPRFFDERSALKLIFGALIRAAARWQRIHLTQLEQRQILALRQELGLDPVPPKPGRENEGKTRASMRPGRPERFYSVRGTSSRVSRTPACVDPAARRLLHHHRRRMTDSRGQPRRFVAAVRDLDHLLELPVAPHRLTSTRKGAPRGAPKVCSRTRTG